MKRLAISVFISLAILILWASISISLESFEFISEETSNTLATPFRLPTYIYQDILGYETPYFESEEDINPQEIMLILYAILLNVLIYSGILYLIISVFMRFVKKKKENNKNEKPPNPPVFNQNEFQ